METTKKTFQYLSGPVSWYEYEFKDDKGKKKMIHLFGDRHNLTRLCNPSLKCMKNDNSSKSDCYDFVYFLKELFDIIVYNKQYADFFLEFRYNIHKENIYESLQGNNIGKVYSQFEECLQYTKEDCKYLPYVRMHYTDLRDAFIENKIFEGESIKKYSSFTEFLYWLYRNLVFSIEQALYRGFGMPSLEERLKKMNMMDQIFLLLKNYCKFYKIFFESKNFVEDFSEFVDPYLKVLREKSELFDAEDIDHFLNIVKLMKKMKHPKSKSSILAYQIYQLEKDNIMVNGKNVADLIYPFIENKCKEMVQKYNGILQKWDDISKKILKFDVKTIRDIYSKDFSPFVQQLEVSGIYLDSYILDGYILPRLFRSFSTSGKKHNPSILSIIYAGDVHINTQTEFLNNVLGLTPIHEVKDGKEVEMMKKSQCLHSKFFQDIFAKFNLPPTKGKEENFTEIVNPKNFDFIYQGEDGLLLKAKKIGPFCELLPEIDICSEDEGENVNDYYIWIDKDEQKFVFNTKQDIYRDEDNEPMESDQINLLREEIPEIDKIFKDHEKELLNPTEERVQKRWESNPRSYANILYTYAQHILGGRWKDAEENILKSPSKAVDYAIYVLKKRWPDEILSNGENLREKAENIIRMGDTSNAEKYFKKFGIQ
jgi:hypothetical protein